MVSLSRRHVLSGIAGAATLGTLGSLPIAHAQAQLDASIDVKQDWRDTTGDIGHIVVRLENERPVGADPIEPIVQCWGMGRQTQIAWNVVEGETPIPPGEAERLHLRPPGNRMNVRLIPGNRGMARCWDRGTDNEAHDIWTAGELPAYSRGPHGSERQPALGGES